MFFFVVPWIFCFQISKFIDLLRTPDLRERVVNNMVVGLLVKTKLVTGAIDHFVSAVGTHRIHVW